MKSKKVLRLTALLICVVMMLPMIFACGDKPATDTGSTTAAGTTTSESTTAAPTPEPTTPEPTEPPTTAEPFVADPSMTYWEQIEAELAFHGLTGGVKMIAGDDEAALMKAFTTNGTSKEELDVSGDGVPFSAAYRITTKADTEQFWNASYNRAFMKDIPVQEGDLVVGVMWVRGERIAETENFMADDPASYYIAIKTATDNWGTEGDVDPRGQQDTTSEWHKVFFYGYVLNEESSSSNLQLQIFLGYGNQYIDFGGIAAYWFPWTVDNEKAVFTIVEY